MNADNILAFLHLLAVVWYVAGLTAVLLPLVGAWRSGDLPYQVTAFGEAAQYQGTLLLPGAIAVGATGVFLWAEMGYNLVATGWLLVLEILYLIVLLVCVPLLGLGLRRVRLLSLQAAKAGEVTAELEEALSDNVSIVFGGIAVILLPVMVYLSVFKPL